MQQRQMSSSGKWHREQNLTPRSERCRPVVKSWFSFATKDWGGEANSRGNPRTELILRHKRRPKWKLMHKIVSYVQRSSLSSDGWVQDSFCTDMHLSIPNMWPPASLQHSSGSSSMLKAPAVVGPEKWTFLHNDFKRRKKRIKKRN
jgi:hypothetical protein